MEINTFQIKKSIERGVEFLAKNQHENGSFECFVSTVFDDYSNANQQSVPAIVPTNIVLSSLIHLNETLGIKIIKDRSAQFLLTQKSSHWAFNYWFRDSPEYTAVPYPDDLDDTFCALAALYEYDRDLFSGDVMGKIITMLTSAEISEGGPYNMWLVSKTAQQKWLDIDLVVNSNIAFFLYLNDIKLPNLDAFIEKAIKDNDYEFPYNTIYPGIYFISRFYIGSQVSSIIELLLSKKSSTDNAWENPLRTALAVSAILNLSDGKLWKEVKNSVDYIVQSQSADGGWPAYSFFYQMKLADRILFAGSAIITTAFCLETLDKFAKAQKLFFYDSVKVESVIKNNVDMREFISNSVIEKIEFRFTNLSSEFEKIALDFFEERIAKDSDQQIALLPLFFAESIGALNTNTPGTLESKRPISSDFLIELGVANTYGWMAYDIYDDFLDGEGDPVLLSLANMCLREAYMLLSTILPASIGFTRFTRDVFDKIDTANMWEVVHCHINYLDKKIELPQYCGYGQLAEKSLGHMLGPIAILFSLGYTADSLEVKNTIDFFKHYLIARQLNDDAHDWQEDLKNGYVNVVTVQIVSDIKKVGQENFAPENLEQMFWNITAITVCNDILKEIELARKSFKKIPIIKNAENILALLKPIEKSANSALEEQKRTKQFLSSYHYLNKDPE